MQSNTSTLKQTFRNIFSLSSSNKKPLSPNRDSSELIGAGSDITMNAIQTSLVVLKEASALATKIPYIAPIAGLLLQVLQMRDEVKQFKGDWDIVMQKVANVASVVVDVGESARMHNLNEEDLPADLRDALRSLQSDLHGIEGALRECADVRGIKKIILRGDMLRKVKQYDVRLSNVLQVVQTRLAFRIRLAQIIQDRQVTHADLGEITTSVTHSPHSPQLFFGRDAELTQVIDMIFSNIRSRPARIAILGPGGYGKTTLANAVLTHHRIQEHYKDARYFALGVLHSGSDASWPHIRTRLNARECILCLDNFESPWDQDGNIQSSVEELLSRITELHYVTVLVTMRGTIRPAQTQWTLPPLAPLRTLDHNAAKEIWEHITGDYNASAEELIKAVDHVPLALSINSKRMRAYPSAKGLLGVLSMLPDGIHVKQLERFQAILNDINVTLNLHVLQQCSLVTGFVSSKHEDSLVDFYITLASIYPYKAQPHDYAEMVLEVNNTKAILSSLLKPNYEDKSKLIGAILTLTEFLTNIGDLSDKLVRGAMETMQQQDSHKSLFIKCLDKWGRIIQLAGDINYAQLKVQEAEKLCSLGKENGSGLHADILSHLAEIYKFQYAFNEAEAAYQRALKLHEITNDALGQGNDYHGLGGIYHMLNRQNEAEASYLRALEFYKAGDSVLNQGIEAEAAFQKALEIHDAVHDIIWQGNDHQGLGIAYTSMNRLDEAESSLQKALELHKAANVLQNQGNDYNRLGEIYLIQNKLDGAESSFQKALELYEATNAYLGQGNAFNGLGRVHFKMGMLEKAKGMFEKALSKHKQVKSTGNEKADLWWLNRISTGVGQISIQSTNTVTPFYQTMSTIATQLPDPAPPPPPAMLPPNIPPPSGCLSGVLPQMFTGDCSQSKKFMLEFTTFKNFNHDGEAVDDWTMEQLEWLNEQIESGRHTTSEGLWETIAQQFKDAYTDGQAKQKAAQELKSLQMEKGELDAYVVKFRSLASRAGYDTDEEAMLDLFSQGLPNPLVKNIIQFHHPNDWDTWVDAARRQQQDYLDFQTRFGVDTRKGKTCDQWKAAFGVKPAHSSQRDPNAMDTSADRT
ncbi:hypothetical protein B0F90DRAFT_1816933 [Multifurca ochricompacta]|uniref:Retrotransposon gag domain-containing protein n=1 Tax=Multifurca ochricompacta TaxID=376703 RepID=A0AAD4M574_9AGAM|nr:hypothetical protein B0F90DRAFT_1816933 [Multifurca ochricompacta]